MCYIDILLVKIIIGTVKTSYIVNCFLGIKDKVEQLTKK